MNLFTVEHVSKTFGNKVILHDVSCGVQEGDKIGIVGMNGTGKSTFLKMIAGREKADEGQIVCQNGLKIAYLPQNPEYEKDEDILTYVLGGHDMGDWGLISKAKAMLYQVGLTKINQKMSVLSGGERKRAALIQTLLSSFDVLILDEPTNHLDEEMLFWLEDYLSRYRGVLILVTHDRYFLDKVTNKIWEISHGNLYSYTANYSGFLELKAQREETEAASERKRQSVLRMELEWAKRGCRARTTKQKARLERLEALKNGKAPIVEQNVNLNSAETRMGKKTIELHQISKSYGDKQLIQNFEYIALRNQKVGIVGANGCGKSTLMKMIAGEILPDEGQIEIGETIKIGYFSQEEQEMNPDYRVIDYVKDIGEYIPTKDGRISAGQLLEQFLFTPDMQYSVISKLSGGEKRRLHLLGVLAQGANVLLFDEPGNNLDIPTLTILEDYLNSFAGIVIAVSHDRYFLDNVADRILSFEGDGKVEVYEGGYTDYLEAKKKRKSANTETTASQKGRMGEETRKSWKQNRSSKVKFTYKEEREYAVIEEEIAELENKIAEIDSEIEKNVTNAVRLSELMEEKARVEGKLEEKTERWVYLSELAEKMQKQS